MIGALSSIPYGIQRLPVGCSPALRSLAPDLVDLASPDLLQRSTDSTVMDATFTLHSNYEARKSIPRQRTDGATHGVWARPAKQ